MEALERYRDLVDDPTAFLAACRRPLPRTVRVNTIKATPERARAVLEAEGVGIEPIPWDPTLFEIDVESPGNTWAAFHGYVTGQEVASTLPPRLLDPEPGSSIWDACAAPGSKTTQLAAQMDDRGTLVATDRNLGRLSALRFNAERLGVTCVAVDRADARHYAPAVLEGERFDATLVDAPCSGEGMVRKNPGALEDWSRERVRSLAELQRGILERAVELTRPGGRVVYSTCTFAPEENEAVVDAVRSSHPCRVVASELPLETDPGLTGWRDRSFDPALERAIRIYPHRNDTGGFFLAELEVLAS